MQASERWDALFADPRSEVLLERLVNEALAEDDAGETEEFTGDTFLSSDRNAPSSFENSLSSSRPMYSNWHTITSSTRYSRRCACV
jgi:hypothetical protein